MVQGVSLFLPPPNFPMCKNGEKKQSPELATPKNGRVHNLPPLNSPKFMTLPFFGSGKLWTLSFLECGQFMTLLFCSPFWHIGK